MSKKIKYDVMISIKVKKEQAEKLKKLADERDTSQGAIIRQWIENEPEKK
ncbi:MAG: ribbon-helix-helix protein, CopG family [Myroides sp.]